MLFLALVTFAVVDVTEHNLKIMFDSTIKDIERSEVTIGGVKITNMRLVKMVSIISVIIWLDCPFQE